MRRLEGKHLLIDTNLLIAISKYGSFGLFDDFLKELERLNIKSVIEEGALFEYRRGSRRQSDLDDKNTFLDFLFGEASKRMALPIGKDILSHAQELSILYNHKDSRLSTQISFIDCLIAAQLMKYKTNLYLATIDNKDYPLFIFDRLKLQTIDTDKEIINIGIYAFNEKKYEQCKLDFKKAS